MEYLVNSFDVEICGNSPSHLKTEAPLPHSVAVTQNSASRTYTWIQSSFLYIGQWISAVLGSDKDGKNNIAVLDGIRAIATISVIVFHVNRLTGDNLWVMSTNPLASAIATFGGSGVTLFFVLSGFLLFMPFAKSLLFKDAWPSLRAFYLRRVLRILPGYYVALFLIIVLFQPVYLHKDHWGQLFLFVTFFMDSSSTTFRQLNGPFWTLAIEWQFYMLLPLLALGLSLFVRRVSSSPQKRLIVLICCCLGLIAWGLFLRYWGIYFSLHTTQTVLVPRSVFNVALFFFYGQTGKYLENFIVGMLISLCYIYSRRSDPKGSFITWARRLSLKLWGMGLLILVFTALWHYNCDTYPHGLPVLDPLTPVYSWLNETVIAIGYGSCMAAILFGPTGLKWLFEGRNLRWIGLTSYGLYMWHLPLISYFRDHVIPHLHIANRFVTYAFFWGWVVIAVVPVAFLSYALIEKPWIQLGSIWVRGIIKRQARPISA